MDLNLWHIRRYPRREQSRRDSRSVLRIPQYKAPNPRPGRYKFVHKVTHKSSTNCWLGTWWCCIRNRAHKAPCLRATGCRRDICTRRDTLHQDRAVPYIFPVLRNFGNIRHSHAIPCLNRIPVPGLEKIMLIKSCSGKLIPFLVSRFASLSSGSFWSAIQASQSFTHSPPFCDRVVFCLHMHLSISHKKISNSVLSWFYSPPFSPTSGLPTQNFSRLVTFASLPSNFPVHSRAAAVKWTPRTRRLLISSWHLQRSKSVSLNPPFSFYVWWCAAAIESAVGTISRKRLRFQPGPLWNISSVFPIQTIDSKNS